MFAEPHPVPESTASLLSNEDIQSVKSRREIVKQAMADFTKIDVIAYEYKKIS